MAAKTRWGIMGTGRIAHKFADALAVLPDAELVAVGSRTAAAAEKFGAEFKAPRRYGSYAELARDRNVDAIYISTPHPLHRENTLLCLQAGRAVLCEKPFAINAVDAEAMVACAQAKRVFLMEAMWSHFFPAMAKVRELLAAGAIGEVRLVRADFCFRAGLDPASRLFDPALGGGAILDVGVYTVALAHMIYGREPEHVAALAHLGETGVDEQTAMLLGYERGALAVLTCAVRTNATHAAAIYGTDGWIELPPVFWQPDRIVLHAGGKDEELKFDRLGNGYTYEAQEVGRCLREGRLESEVMPHAKTLAIMRTLDRVRAAVGLKYPGE